MAVERIDYSRIANYMHLGNLKWEWYTYNLQARYLFLYISISHCLDPGQSLLVTRRLRFNREPTDQFMTPPILVKNLTRKVVIVYMLCKLQDTAINETIVQAWSTSKYFLKTIVLCAGYYPWVLQLHQVSSKSDEKQKCFDYSPLVLALWKVLTLWYCVKVKQHYQRLLFKNTNLLWTNMYI